MAFISGWSLLSSHYMTWVSMVIQHIDVKADTRIKNHNIQETHPHRPISELELYHLQNQRSVVRSLLHRVQHLIIEEEEGERGYSRADRHFGPKESGRWLSTRMGTAKSIGTTRSIPVGLPYRTLRTSKQSSSHKESVLTNKQFNTLRSQLVHLKNSSPVIGRLEWCMTSSWHPLWQPWGTVH